MSQSVLIELEVPDDLAEFRLSAGLHDLLQAYLDRQDRGETLSPQERQTAEAVVDLAEVLSLLRLRADRAALQTQRNDE